MPTIDRPLEIVAVRDATDRDLLLAREPLIIARSDTAIVRIEVGPAGPLQIRVSADQSWLQFNHAALELEAGGAVELGLSALSDGTEEFAVLRLGWEANNEDFAEHVLIWRPSPLLEAIPAALPAEAPASADPVPAAATGTTPLPDWLRGS